MSKKYFALFFVLFLTLTFCPDTYAKYPPLQNELFALRVMREIYTAQATYYLTVGNGRFGSGIQLFNANLIDYNTAIGVKYGYYFSISEVSGAGNVRFAATATPYRYGKTGKRSFYIDSACKIRGVNKFGRMADANAPLIETCTPTLAHENEIKTIAAMRTLHSAEATYQATTGVGDFGILTQLHNAGLINSTLASGTYAGNTFLLVVLIRNEVQPAFFRAHSIPNLHGETGFRSFYIDVTGVLRGADKNGLFADVNDPPIEN